MADITAAMVKALRDATGQGMMECKKALQEADGDVEAATDVLRAKGVALAEKKSGRETAEGLIAIRAADDATSAAMVEINCETDFCARNDVFQAMVAQVAELATTGADGEVAASDEITGAVQACFNTIGENMSYGRGAKLSGPCVGSYLHHNNKVGVLVALDQAIDADALAGLCMHVAFADPVAITPDDVPADLVEKEKALATQQAIDSGKPPEIAEKIVAGKMGKFLAGLALVEQAYVRDEKMKVKEILGGATITAFARFAIGS
jgi:elongation factor Ts